MWSVLAKIFGSGDVISKGIDLIDSMHTSTEEEVHAKTKAKTEMLNAYAPFKLAQRVIAFAFTFVYLACFSLVLGFTLAERATDAAMVKQVLEDFQIGYAMLIILGFYYSGGALEGIINAKKKK